MHGDRVKSDLLLDTLLWSLIQLQESHKRLSHSATQVGSYLFIFGGHDGGGYMSDLLLFNLGAYTSRRPDLSGSEGMCSE